MLTRHRFLIVIAWGVLLPVIVAWGQTRGGMVRWLECEECSRGDAGDYLTDLPTDYVMRSSLAALDGPTLSSRMRYEAVLKKKFGLLTEYAENNSDSSFVGGESTWESFKKRHLEQYTQSYILKAAWALAVTPPPPGFGQSDLQRQIVNKLKQRYQDAQLSYLRDAIAEALKFLDRSPTGR